jgi:hypothetical protein
MPATSRVLSRSNLPMMVWCWPREEKEEEEEEGNLSSLDRWVAALPTLNPKL